MNTWYEYHNKEEVLVQTNDKNLARESVRHTTQIFWEVTRRPIFVGKVPQEGMQPAGTEK